jgi:hypothetical protein
MGFDLAEHINTKMSDPIVASEITSRGQAAKKDQPVNDAAEEPFFEFGVHEQLEVAEDECSASMTFKECEWCGNGTHLN